MMVQILRATSRREMEESLKRNLEDGWEMLGSMSFAIVQEHNVAKFKHEYRIPMIKR